jgi:hypothetical protein
VITVACSAARRRGKVIWIPRDFGIKRRLVMKKLLVVASFAAVVTYPAAACDWNRAASASEPVVATTEQTPQAAPASPETRSVAVEESARKSTGEQPAVVLITDRH